LGVHTTEGLRKIMDSNDGFVTGHLIKKIRRRTRKIPEILRNDVSVRKILLKSFPRIETNDLQRKRAARWSRVIYLYFRAGYNYKEVAEEMGEKPRTVEMVIRSIFRAVRRLPMP
jgi:DNA-binding NarL/FixJ family response regulator